MVENDNEKEFEEWHTDFVRKLEADKPEFNKAYEEWLENKLIEEAKNKFGNRFSPEDFLTVMPENQLIASIGVAKRVGCSHTTASAHLAKLVEQGKVCRVEIIGGRDAVWQKVV